MADRPNPARDLFLAALDQPDPAAFLDAAGADPSIRRRVDALLAAHRAPDPVLDRPAAEHLSVLPGPVADGLPLAPPPGYVLLEEVGRGGMGVVYRATDTALGRDVAVKLLQGRYLAGSAAAARFVDEARVTARLQHPGVPPVHEVGALPDGRPFLAMKLVAGRTLDALLADRPDPAHDRGRFVAAFEAVCQAVAYAHSKGVIHRDLKPQNVMVGAFGEVQVMDWGLAKELDRTMLDVLPDPGPAATLTPPTDGATVVLPGGTPDGASDRTRAGSVLGTPGFMAPEQARGELDRVDRRADAFGLGAILCVVLTGKPPFAGPDWTATRGKNAAGDLAVTRAALANCGAEPDLVALCEQCLAPNPADRPADAGAVAAAVADLRVQAADRARRAEVDAAAADARAAGERRRRRILLWGGGGLVAVLLLGVAGTTVGLIRADAARATAETAERATEAKRVEADTARARAETKEAEAVSAKADTEAFSKFLVNDVLAAARPAGLQGGLGIDVKMVDALRRAEKQVEAAFAGQPKAEATARHALGATWRTLGRLDAAVPHLKRAVDLRRELGPAHADTLDSLNSLAVVCEQLGLLAEAEERLAEALAGHRRTFGPVAVETLTVAVNLGFVRTARGKFDEALTGLNEAETAAKSAHGRKHPVTLSAAAARGVAYAASGRPADAEPVLAEALAARREVLGDKHANTLVTLRELAAVYMRLNRPADAGPLFAEALAGARDVLGDRHPETLMLLSRTAKLRLAANNLADAEKLLAEALPACRAALAPGHPNTLETLSALGSVRERQGRPAEAVPLYEEILAVLRKSYGPQHTPTVNTARQLGMLYRGLKKPAEAAERLAEALAGCVGRPADNPERRFCELNLGLSLVEAGKPTQAEPHLTAAYQALSRRNNPTGPEKDRLRVVLGALAGVCDKADRPADAANWREKLTAVK